MDTVSFTAEKPALDFSPPDNFDGNQRVDFLAELHHYRGDFFVKEGKNPNVFFVKIFDVPAFLQETKAEIDKDDKEESINNLIDSVINPNKNDNSSASKFDDDEDDSEEIATLEEERKIYSEDLDSYYDKIFDKNGKFKSKYLQRLQLMSDGLSEVNESLHDITAQMQEVPDYVTKFIDKEYGAVAKIVLPEYLPQAILHEIKHELNAVQLDSTRTSLTNWLAEKKRDTDDKILEPAAN